MIFMLTHRNIWWCIISNVGSSFVHGIYVYFSQHSDKIVSVSTQLSWELKGEEKLAFPTQSYSSVMKKSILYYLQQKVEMKSNLFTEALLVPDPVA